MTIHPSRYRRFVLIGGGRPLLTFATAARERSRDVFVISSPGRLAEPAGTGPLSTALAEAGIRFVSRTDLPVDTLAECVDEATLGLSFGAPWIFRPEHIDLFGGALLNLHAAALPRHRGAGGDTWQILQRRRVGGFTLHVVEPTIDTGDIVLAETFTYPETCLIPAERQAIAAKHETRFVLRMADALCGTAPLDTVPQDHAKSTYWPRLHTMVNGFVDWSWTAEEVRTFVDAFDDPYPGAGTFLGERELRLKGAETADDGAFHPFQAGLVYRVHEGVTYVAARGGALAFAGVLDATTGKPAHGIHPGVRLHTPRIILERALTTRPRYTPRGLQRD